MPVRPKSIVQFDYVYLAIILIELLNTVLSWNDVMASVDVQRMVTQVGKAPVYGSALIGVAIQLLLWYFITRRGSVVAKWIFVILYAISAVWSAFSLAGSGASSPIIGVFGVALLVLQVIAIVLLFRADARAWFGEDEVIEGGA